MPQALTKHEIKTCPRCGQGFECKRNNPVHCDCARVTLAEDTLHAIEGHYRDCLCLACLTALAAGADLVGAPSEQAPCLDRHSGHWRSRL